MRRKYPLSVGTIYHIYNRGTAKCSIYEKEADNWRFIQGLFLFNDKNSTSNILWQLERDRGKLTMNVLKNYVVSSNKKREPLVRIMAYCLMGNHYHLLLEEIIEGGITQFMHKLGVGYVKYFNNKHNRVGTLFQGPFKNIPVEDDLYLQYLLVYINVINPIGIIESNLKKEGIRDIEKGLDFAESYSWSSHIDYLNKRNSLILDRGILKDFFSDTKDYVLLVKSVLEEKKYTDIGHLTLE